MQIGGASDDDFVSYVSKWHEAGASLIGGCCRTTPNTIRAIAKALCKDFDAGKGEAEQQTEVEKNSVEDKLALKSASFHNSSSKTSACSRPLLV